MEALSIIPLHLAVNEQYVITWRQLKGPMHKRTVKISGVWAKVRFSILLFFSECISCVQRDVWLGSPESLSMITVTKRCSVIYKCVGLFLPEHWQIVVITFKALTTQQPHYLSELIQINVPHRHLWSADAERLAVPRTKLKFTNRAFSHAAPTIWNGLAVCRSTLSTVTLSQFKRLVQAELYNRAFDNIWNLTFPHLWFFYWMTLSASTTV